jgi:arsenate reductase
MIVVYGITNCDTVKRARAWLEARGQAHRFHDFKRAGVPPDHLDRWLAALGPEHLLNRRGTTWRQLDAARQARVVDAASARELMLEQSSVVRRPVVEWGDGTVSAGFDEADWAARV